MKSEKWKLRLKTERWQNYIYIYIYIYIVTWWNHFINVKTHLYYSHDTGKIPGYLHDLSN